MWTPIVDMGFPVKICGLSHVPVGQVRKEERLLKKKNLFFAYMYNKVNNRFFKD